MLCIVCFEGPKIIHIYEPLSYSKEGMEMGELMELIVFIWIPRPPNRNVEILLLRPVPHPRSHIQFHIPDPTISFTSQAASLELAPKAVHLQSCQDNLD